MIKKNKTIDDFFMLLALKEAKKGFPYAYPNPLVGSVIVKNGKILSKGYHKYFGGPHAEVDAITKISKKDLENSTLYVTLEPCSTYGKTPPCTDLIIKSKIKRVVIGTLDPNPINFKKGVEILKKNKIDVDFVSEEVRKKCIDINEPFFKNMIEKLPYVVIKFASSIDSKIANKYYHSKWISSEKSRIFAHKLRLASDMIVVGANTLIKDNPYLNVRYFKTKKQPSVCIIAPNSKIPENLNVFLEKRDVYILTKKHAYSKAKVIEPVIKNGEIELYDFLKKIYKMGFRNILVEGGGKTIGSFIKQDCFDKISLFLSPIIIGSDGINAIESSFGLNKNEIGIKLNMKAFKKIENDLYIEFTKPKLSLPFVKGE
jgi:diaminohydroxyphosphoribosylaminopyrimidine deaminase/5-amino-6-(5-phosphoribosylamino)uracil reductase